MAEAIAQADPTDVIMARLVSPKTTGVVALPLHVDRVALAAVDTAGGVFSWQNPLSVKVIATAIVNVTTVATAACTVDVGLAANATTLADTLLDGVDVNAAVIRANPFDNKGTNGKGVQLVDEKGGSNDFITGSKASGASAGIVGFAYIVYFPVE